MKYKKGIIGVVVAVIALLVLYFGMQAMGRPMSLKSLIYGFIAVGLIVVAGVYNSRMQQQKAEVLARVYLNGDTAYQRTGEMQHFTDIEGAVAACAVFMNDYSPRAKTVEPPEGFQPFYAVNTSNYKNDGEVWEGVFRIASTHEEIPFASEEELTKIMEERMVLEPSGMWAPKVTEEAADESALEDGMTDSAELDEQGEDGTEEENRG